MAAFWFGYLDFRGPKVLDKKKKGKQKNSRQDPQMNLFQRGGTFTSYGPALLENPVPAELGSEVLKETRKLH